MEVKLLTSHNTISDMMQFAALAALTCHDNTDKDVEPKELLIRIIKAWHDSILEHIYFTYSVKGISRALLQELARHRHISLSVESTRHTLRKQLNKPKVLSTADFDKYGGFGNMLSIVKRIADEYPDMPNDLLKYYIPEFWPTNLVLSTNVRELRHILKLRTHPSALLEFRTLGIELFSRVPDEFKYLLDDCVYIGG